MKQKIKIILPALILIILVVGVAGNGWFLKKESQITSGQPKEFFTLRVSIPPGSYISPYDIAEELGFLDEEGIKLERTGVIYSGPESMMAVSGWTNDATVGVALSATINAKTGGHNLKAVVSAHGVNSNVMGKYFVFNNSSIFTAKDLNGKKFGVNTLGAHMDYMIQEYLKKNGMTKEGDNVQLIVIGSEAARQQAFRMGQIDITSGDNRFFTLKEGGGVRILFTDYDVAGNISTGVILMNEKFIKEHPDIVRRFVAANARAIDWADANPNEARELVKKIVKKNGGNPELADYWEGFGTHEHGLVTEQDYQYWIDIFLENGKLKPGQISPSDIYTNEFNPYFKR